jgi:hypothetical protein
MIILSWPGRIGNWIYLLRLEPQVLRSYHYLDHSQVILIFTLLEMIFLPTSWLSWQMSEILALTSRTSSAASPGTLWLLAQTSSEWILSFPNYLYLSLYRTISLSNSFFNFSYLGSYACTAKKTPDSASPDFILSVSAGNKLVSMEVSVRYGGHILQQAGYQRSSALVPAGTRPPTHPFRNKSQYRFTFPK